MKGFSDKEIDLLLKEAKSARKNGTSLTEVFDSVAKKTGRAKGSVRNYYYSLLGGAKIDRVIDSGLKVEKNVGFSKEDELKLVRDVFRGVKSGKSVRRTIIDMSNGNDKLALRMQNKYRNLVKSSPELVCQVAEEMKLRNVVLRKEKKGADFSVYIKKVSEEIDKLVLRIREKCNLKTDELLAENQQLRSEIAELKIKMQQNFTADYFKNRKLTM